MKVLQHFMWGYQSHFRINQEDAIRRALEAIDPELDSEVFIVGIRTVENYSPHPACVDPETNFWAESSLFDEVLDSSERIRLEYPESQLLHSHPIAQKRHNEYLRDRALRDGILQAIAGCDVRPPSMEYFVSHPTRVAGFHVSLIIGVDRRVLDRHPALSESSIRLSEVETFSSPVSLVHATIQELLGKATGELRLPEPGAGREPLNSDEVIRSAGSRFVSGLERRATLPDFDFGGRLFESCNGIARAFYEGGSSYGQMILASRSSSSVSTVVEFEKPVRLSLARAARKLLELASRGLSLHTDGSRIFGLVRSKNSEPAAEREYVITFLGHHHWRVSLGPATLMEVRYGQPFLPKPKFSKERLAEDLPRVFPDVTVPQVKRLVSLVEAACEEKHGTMLVISVGAKAEASRLAEQSTTIEPRLLSAKVLRHLTAIDGAVLLSPAGKCFAVGVILDGKASEYGDPARGARYNSAIRYLCSVEYRTMVVIVSEDGDVEYHPCLPPIIEIAAIEERIAKIEGFASEKTLDRRSFYKTLDWLDKHKIYLTEESCQRVNSAVERFHERLDEDDPGGLRIVRQPFVMAEGVDHAELLR